MINDQKICEIIQAIPLQPFGNIDGLVGPRIKELARGPITSTAELHELNGLVARAIYLAHQPTVEPNDFPTGGSPVAMARSA